MAERAKWVVIGILICAMATLTGTALGVFVMSAPGAKSTPNTEQRLTVQVTDAPVRSVVSADATADPVSALPVRRQGIHTATGATAQTPLKEGDVVAVVDEQATLLLQGNFPLYRTLTPGSTGADVAEVRAALGRLKLLDDPQGVSFDKKMAEALLKLFQQAGYPLRTAAGNPATAETAAIPPSHIAVLGALPAVADKPCGVMGSTTEEVVCTLRSEKANLVIQLPATQKVSAGQVVELGLGGGKLVSARVGKPLPGSADSAKRFLVDLDGQGQPPISEIVRATVIQEEAPKGTLSVPAAALRGLSGSHAQLQLEDDTLLSVSVGLCAQGRCVVAGDGLKVGTTVVVAS